MAAKMQDQVCLNNGGTYSIACAQLHWGKMAALLLRLLRILLAQILWAFVYMDDYIILLRRQDLDSTRMAIIMFLLSAGCPLS